MNDLELKAIWPGWKEVPETMCEGTLTPIRWFKKDLNKKYRIYRSSSISKAPNTYCQFKLSVGQIYCALEHLKIDTVKPNGIYNLPCFPSNKKNDVIDMLINFGFILVKL